MLISLIKELESTQEGHDLLVKHGFASGPFNPHISTTEVIAILKLVCAGAAVACPVIETL